MPDGVKNSAHPGWDVYVRGGRENTGKDAIAWAEEVVNRGAGELLSDQHGCRRNPGRIRP